MPLPPPLGQGQRQPCCTSTLSHFIQCFQAHQHLQTLRVSLSSSRTGGRVSTDVLTSRLGKQLVLSIRVRRSWGPHFPKLAAWFWSHHRDHGPFCIAPGATQPDPVSYGKAPPCKVCMKHCVSSETRLIRQRKRIASMYVSSKLVEEEEEEEEERQDADHTSNSCHSSCLMTMIMANIVMDTDRD